MSTRALVLFEHEKGMILSKRDGFPRTLGLNILFYIEIMSKHIGIYDLYNYLISGCGLMLSFPVTDKREKNTSIEYIYRITDSGVYVRGILTDEENELQFADDKRYMTIIDKSSIFRRLIIKDDKLCFIDTDEQIKEVTI